MHSDPPMVRDQHKRTVHRAERLKRVGLIALYAFTISAVVGYALFGRDPGRLAGLPTWAMELYGLAFGFFALGHVWLSMAVLTAVLIARARLRWVAPFLVMYAVSLGSEWAGTTWGIPFGAYSYSELLAPMWLDRVPVVIPLSWFFMAVASYAVAARVSARPLVRVGAGSLVLLGWDLAPIPR